MKRTKILSESELSAMRANERVFHLDSESFLVYTGSNSQSRHPFVRIGSATKVYPEWASWIGHVILSDKDPVNIGREVAWMKHGMASGLSSLKYVGSKKRLDQLYNVTGMPELESNNRQLPMTGVPYGQISESVSKKQHVYAVENKENFTIEIAGKKIFDFADRNRRNNWSLSKECKSLSEILEKTTLGLKQDENHVSFVWIPSKDSMSNEKGKTKNISCPTLYWNCHGKGFLVEPRPGFHRDLFLAGIDPCKVHGVSSEDGRRSGVNDVLLLADRFRKEILVDIPDESQFVMLKKIFNQASLRPISSGVAFPFERRVFLSKSRRWNYSAISWAYEPNSDCFINVLFPSKKESGRKNIENIRPPYDVEVQRIDQYEDLDNDQAKKPSLSLCFPGKIDETAFGIQRLRDGMFPLIPSVEYIFHQAEDHGKIVQACMRCFANTPYGAALTKIYQFHRVDQQEVGKSYLTESLAEMLHVYGAVDKNSIVEVINLHSFVRLLKSMPATHIYTKDQQKLFRRIEKQDSVKKIQFDSILSLAKDNIQIHICSFGGGRQEKKSLLFIENVPVKKLDWYFPEMAVNYRGKQEKAVMFKKDRAYIKQLAKWDKLSERRPEWAVYEPVFRMLEKMMEQKRYFYEQWESLTNLVAGLGSQSKGSESVFGDRSYLQSANRSKRRVALWLNRFGFANKVSKANAIRVWADQSKNDLTWARNLLLLLVVLFLGGYLIYTSTAQNNRPSLAGNLLELAAVGDFQGEEPISGSENIEVLPAEVLAYANILAERNNFRRLSAQDATNQNNANEGKRNPNLVFPRDRLKLPDNRLIVVEPKSHIWQIAEREYRKDFARILLLEKEILENQDSKRIQQYDNWIQRLAVTPKMKEVMVRIQRIIADSSTSD